MSIYRFMLFLLISGSIALSSQSCNKDDEDTKKEICGNGIDDDGNGFTDGDDLACKETGSKCGNGIDDDGDTFTDCDDFDCAGQSGC